MKSDYNLVEEFRNGSEYSFVILYDRYKNSLYHFCLRLLQDEEKAKDVFQDVFISVYQNIGNLKNCDMFKSWLYSIARNKCFTQIKRDKRFSGIESDYLSDPNDDPLNILIKNENSDGLGKAFDLLSPEYKEIIFLREYNDFSYFEISEILNISEAAVKSKLFKARTKLYQIVKRTMKK